MIGKINDFINMFKGYCFHKYKHVNEMKLVYENGLINKSPTGKYLETKKSWSNPIENLMEMIKTG